MNVTCDSSSDLEFNFDVAICGCESVMNSGGCSCWVVTKCVRPPRRLCMDIDSTTSACSNSITS